MRSGRGRGSDGTGRLVSRLSAIAALGILGLSMAPLPGVAQQAAPDAASDLSYPTRVWTEVPATSVSETSYRSGFGTGVAANGEAVELRPGSPFVRIGERLVQLANPPYLASGLLHVPAELLERSEFDPRTASASSANASASPASSPASPDGETVPPVVESETSRRPGPWRVVIDPGHGGRDPGTQSPRTRTAERDITLAVSRMVREELAAVDDIDPWLTRSTDVFIDVPDRPRLAVQRDGDLFVSIHVDAQPGGKTSARGFTTYYLGPARTEQGRQAAIRENTVPGAREGEGPDIDQLEFILAGLDQGTHLQESVRFGGFIQNELRRVVDSPDRGVRSGPYWVLVRATSNMPTVLVELGFITNPDEERRLRDPRHQRTMAKAIATAIRRYLDEKQDRLDALVGGR